MLSFIVTSRAKTKSRMTLNTSKASAINFNIKKRIIYGVFAVIFLIAIITWLIINLLNYTNSPNVFLGTTFSMTIPQVQRALKHHDIQLFDRITFEQLKSTPKSLFWSKHAIPFFYDTEIKTVHKYMPAIEMFNSQVIAEFEFYNNHLGHIELHVFPLEKQNAMHVIESITSQLQSRFQPAIKNTYPVSGNKLADNTLQKTQQSTQSIPDAYSLSYQKHNILLSLWVNLTDTANPIIHIYITPSLNQYATHRKYNDEIAFT